MASPVRTSSGGFRYAPGVKRVQPTTRARDFIFLPSNGALGTSVPYKRSGHIPGYGGYVAHSTLVAGRTFGETTRRTLNRSVTQLYTDDAIPADPQSANKFKGYKPSSLSGHIPGFTGWVPHSKEQFGVSYGRSSLKGGYRNITGKKARRDLNNVSLRLSCGPQKS